EGEERGAVDRAAERPALGEGVVAIAGRQREVAADRGVADEGPGITKRGNIRVRRAVGVVAVAQLDREVAVVGTVRPATNGPAQADGAIAAAHADVRAAADDEWPHVLQLVVAVAQIDVDVAADGGRERR